MRSLLWTASRRCSTLPNLYPLFFPLSEYEIETILSSRKARGKEEFLVQWVGYGEIDNTWEPIDNLANGKTAIAKFRLKEHSNSPHLGAYDREVISAPVHDGGAETGLSGFDLLLEADRLSETPSPSPPPPSPTQTNSFYLAQLPPVILRNAQEYTHLRGEAAGAAPAIGDVHKEPPHFPVTTAANAVSSSPPPPPPPPPPLASASAPAVNNTRFYMVTHTFEARASDELTAAARSIVVLISEQEAGWALARLVAAPVPGTPEGGKGRKHLLLRSTKPAHVGLIPSSFLALVNSTRGAAGATGARGGPRGRGGARRGGKVRARAGTASTGASSRSRRKKPIVPLVDTSRSHTKKRKVEIPTEAFPPHLIRYLPSALHV